MIEPRLREEHKNINGWGYDADLENRPYKPVHRFQENTGAHWTKPDAQPVSVEVLRTVERNDMPGVFGTNNPPRGLSGMLRRFAFKSGEGNFSHWLPLLIADRIDFVEGMIEDAAKGKVPRLFGDGWAMDYKYDRKKFYYRVAKNTLVVGGTLYLLNRVLRTKK